MRFFLLLLCALAIAAPAEAIRARAKITIGFNPADRTAAVEANGRRLSDYVKKKTGLAVNTFVAKDYESLIDALKSGKVDFAFLPPFSFVKAEASADGKLLLKAVRHGQAIYYSAILVRVDSGIEKLEDLKGHSIAWVERDSATGYLVPRAELLKRKLDPDSFLGKQTFKGTHDAVVMAVYRKEADAGATWVNDPEAKNGSSWQMYLRKPEELAAVKMIYVSDPIPGDALTTTNRLLKEEPVMVDKVTKVMQRMGEGLDGQQILRDLYGIDQMVPASSKDFDPLRADAKAVGAAKH
ncbi:MAG: phosphate/phosphite/phosphonate ABC transporter substrate-binding protein [Bdellovibrionota bacterium]